MKKSNLKPWQPGISGNPNGRPKGSRSIKKVIVDMLGDPNTYNMLPRNAIRGTRTPLEAIVCMLLVKAIRGDVRAAEVLLRYSVDRDELAEEPDGFFSNPKKIVFEIVDTNGKPFFNRDYDKIDPETGMLKEPAEIEEPSKIPAIAA